MWLRFGLVIFVVVVVVVVDVRVKDVLILHATIFCYVYHSFDATHVS